ncbi:MAG: hypothetical protein ACKVOU_02340 [Cytophagales bacterium]
MRKKSLEFTAIRILEKYNFSREDAKAFLETIKEAKSDDRATKANILLLPKDIAEIKKDIGILVVKIESSKNQIIIRVFGIMVAMAGLMIAILKLT